MTSPVKEFVLTHFIEDIQQIDEEWEYSETEVHFNVPWRITYYKNGAHLCFFLQCLQSSENTNWSVDTDFKLKIVAAKTDIMSIRHTRCFKHDADLWGLYDFVLWDRLENFYSMNGQTTLEAHVKIIKMTGCGKEKLKDFDQTVEKYSDVVLVVQDEKFYLSKKFLALQSPYFDSLLLGNFDESKQSEVILKDINSDDFQNFLELLHGENSIDDSTIDGILHLAHMYDVPTAIRRCEEFLLERSKNTKQKKLQLSSQYNLNNLKEKCLSEIETVDDIRAVAAANLDDLSISNALLQKSLALLSMT